jgi:hypothetical protein
VLTPRRLRWVTCAVGTVSYPLWLPLAQQKASELRSQYGGSRIAQVIRFPPPERPTASEELHGYAADGGDEDDGHHD